MGATKVIPADGLVQCLRDPLVESLPKPVQVLPSPEQSYSPPSVCSLNGLHLQPYPQRFLIPEASLGVISSHN